MVPGEAVHPSPTNVAVLNAKNGTIAALLIGTVVHLVVEAVAEVEEGVVEEVIGISMALLNLLVFTMTTALETAIGLPSGTGQPTMHIIATIAGLLTMIPSQEIHHGTEEVAHEITSVGLPTGTDLISTNTAAAQDHPLLFVARDYPVMSG